MFPPLDQAILDRNPEFALLYKKLTEVVLNPDGSTKLDSAASKERDAVRERLKEHRIRTAKHRILCHAVATAAPAPAPTDADAAVNYSNSQPHSMTSITKGKDKATSRSPQDSPEADSDGLVDLLLVLPPLLATPAPTLSPSSLSLLFSNPPLTSLPSLLPSLAELVSSTLYFSALDLAGILLPSANPSSLHRELPRLPSIVSSLSSTLTSTRDKLLTAHLQSLGPLMSLIELHTSCIAHLIRALETKHGIMARSLELHAQETSLLAHKAEADAQLAVLTLHDQIYDQRTTTAVKSYLIHLRDAKTRGEERLRGLKAELAEYGVGVEGGGPKEKMMREMAEAHGDMTRQISDARTDLNRLRKA